MEDYGHANTFGSFFGARPSAGLTYRNLSAVLGGFEELQDTIIHEVGGHLGHYMFDEAAASFLHISPASHYSYEQLGIIHSSGY